MREQLSPKPWTLGVKLSPGPNVSEFRETGYPESGPVRLSFDSEKSRPGLAYLIAEPDVVRKLDGPGGELTNRPDMVSPRTPDGADMLSPYAPNE